MSFLRTAFSVCAGFRSYRAIRDVPVTVALKYLGKLVFGLTTLVLLGLAPTMLERAESLVGWADRNFPVFSVREGRVETSAPQPYRAGDEEFMFLLDTTGQTQSPETNSLMGLLVETDHIVFWAKNTNTPTAIVHSQRAELRGFPDGVVNGEYLRVLIRSFLWVGWPLGWLVTGLLAMLVTLVQAYLFSFFGALMERGVPRALQTAQLLNIAIYAATPASVVYAAYVVLQLPEVNLWLLYLTVYGVYLVGAAGACHDSLPDEKPEEDELL